MGKSMSWLYDTRHTFHSSAWQVVIGRQINGAHQQPLASDVMIASFSEPHPKTTKLDAEALDRNAQTFENLRTACCSIPTSQRHAWPNLIRRFGGINLQATLLSPQLPMSSQMGLLFLGNNTPKIRDSFDASLAERTSEECTVRHVAFYSDSVLAERLRGGLVFQMIESRLPSAFYDHVKQQADNDCAMVTA